MKLNDGLLKTKNEQRDASIGVDRLLAPHEDEIIIPNPNSRMAKAICCKKKLRKSLGSSSVTKTQVLSLKELTNPLTVNKSNNNNNKSNTNKNHRISRHSTVETGPVETKIFQAPAPANTTETVTSGSRIRAVTENAQNRVSNNKDNENKGPNGSTTYVDIRTFYKKVAVETNVRTGDQWTAGYGERRRQQRRRHPQKQMLHKRPRPKETPYFSATPVPARMPYFFEEFVLPTQGEANSYL